MLNNNSSLNVSVSSHVNAVTGNIIKTYKDSYFKRFNLSSRFADEVFKENADKVVIQMTICGSMEVIAELIDKEKYIQTIRSEYIERSPIE